MSHVYPRPPGRAPNGSVWDGTTGTWGAGGAGVPKKAAKKKSAAKPPRREFCCVHCKAVFRSSKQLDAHVTSEHPVFDVSESVEANYQNSGSWWDADVISCNNDGTYDLAYDDGDTEDNVAAKFIRRKEGAQDAGGSAPSAVSASAGQSEQVQQQEEGEEEEEEEQQEEEGGGSSVWGKRRSPPPSKTRPVYSSMTVTGGGGLWRVEECLRSFV